MDQQRTNLEIIRDFHEQKRDSAKRRNSSLNFSQFQNLDESEVKKFDQTSKISLISNNKEDLFQNAFGYKNEQKENKKNKI
jgi:hypothetical protein